MNHLPWPKNKKFPPPEVPYVCGDEPDYDGLSFPDFPLRQGWSAPFDTHRWMESSPETVAVRAQSWLFFGLLKIFFGPRFKKYEFVKLSRKSNIWVLDTSALPRYCSYAVNLARKGTLASQYDLPDLKALGAYWNTAFLEAKKQDEALSAHLNRSLDYKLMLVELPISLLLQSLRRMVERLFWHDEIAPAMCTVQVLTAKFSIWQMMKSEWCECQLKYFYTVYSPFLNHYLSGLPRSRTNGNHEFCTWDLCVGDNVDEANYKPQHTDDDCSCLHLGPDMNQVTCLLRANQLPLIRMSLKSGSLILNVVAADRDTRYISISHVWIGGLGNFRDNKLPRCQLLKLYECLSKVDCCQPSESISQLFPSGVFPSMFDTATQLLLSQNNQRLPSIEDADQTPDEFRPVTFWMDTLCIPVAPRYRDLRMKAIGDMALTYAAAEKCLVLDPELCQISMKTLTDIQLNAHVLSSSWVRRSWTFQEAKLSRVWYVQFSDGLYNPNSVRNIKLDHRLYCDKDINRSDAHALASEAISWYHDMPPARQVDMYTNQIHQEFLHGTSYRFYTIWNNLVSRSTSKPEDVHGILANLLDLSATEVLALPLEDRMKAIIGAQETISPMMLYGNGRKIKDPANRWVPAFPSFTYLSSSYGLMKPVSGGYLLDTGKNNPVGFIIDKMAPRHAKFRVAESAGLGPLWIQFYPENDGPPVEFCAPGEILALIYFIGDLMMLTENRIVGRPMLGARFALRRKENKTFHLVYEHSFCFKQQVRDNFGWKEEDYPIIDAERTPDDAVFQLDCGT